MTCPSLDSEAARRLAAALILLAWDQAQGRRCVGIAEERNRQQEEARAFIKGRCECLAFWCELAEVDEGPVRRKVLTGSR